MIQGEPDEPTFDLRLEIPPEFLEQWRTEMMEAGLDLPGDAKSDIREAVFLRKQMNAVPVLDQMMGERVLPLNTEDQEKVESKIKFGLKDLSHLTGLQYEEFKLYEAIKDTANYHEASVGTHPVLMGDEVINWILAHLPHPTAALVNEHYALLVLRPDKRLAIRELAEVFIAGIRQMYEHRLFSFMEFANFLEPWHKLLLLLPKQREAFPFTPADERLARKLIQQKLRVNPNGLMPVLKALAVLSADDAWVDDQGKIQLKSRAAKFSSATPLPDRPLA